jgi:hypothetical protein
MKINDLIDWCAEMIKNNNDVLLYIKGKKPLGFPNGYLACVLIIGLRTYYFDPLKVLSFCRNQKKLGIEYIENIGF